MLKREPKFGLTSREVEVLQSASEGNTAKQTAKALGKSERTVETQRITARNKLSASTISQAVAIALRAGVIIDAGAVQLNESRDGLDG